MKVTVNFDKAIGKIKPMHGVGQPPFVGSNFSLFHYLTEAGIPFSRLHDVGGVYGGGRWVDVPNIFRDFNRDPEDEDAYDFTFTDLLITALMKCGAEPFFRLGVTIENDCRIKAYRIYPPADNMKWARICEHIIRHYTEGWAKGFYYNIRYWEIWNEPDNHCDINKNQMWRGTKEQFFELYGVASKHLKSCFPHLKFGGYASCGFYSVSDSEMSKALSISNTTSYVEHFTNFFNDFLKYVKENDCPLDFFSWHTYDNVKANITYAKYARRRLDEEGFTQTETSLNEWNMEIQLRGTAKHAAMICANILSMQNLPVDTAMFYDARLGVSQYGSMFNPLTREPFLAYYGFKAFNELYKLGTQVELTVDSEDLYAVAARCENEGCIVIANPTDEDVALEFSDALNVVECYITEEGRCEEKITPATAIPKNSFITFKVKL